MTAIVYYAKRGGLANRLRALVGYQALSEILDLPFYLCWVSNVWCDTPFEQLFESEHIEIISQKEFNKMSASATVYEMAYWYDEIWRQHMVEHVSREEFIETAHKYLKKLKPVKPIEEVLDTISLDLGIENLTGIHIRWTDNRKNNKKKAKRNSHYDVDFHSTVEGFERFIDEEIEKDAENKMFLATDNTEIEEALRQKYKGRIVVYPKSYRKLGYKFSLREFKFKREERASSVEDALIEMLLLSRCKTIVGTYFSSFSKFSSILGNNEYYEVRGTNYFNCEYVDGLR